MFDSKLGLGNLNPTQFVSIASSDPTRGISKRIFGSPDPTRGISKRIFGSPDATFQSRLCVAEPDVKFSNLREFSPVNTAEFVALLWEFSLILLVCSLCVPRCDGVWSLASGGPPHTPGTPDDRACVVRASSSSRRSPAGAAAPLLGRHNSVLTAHSLGEAGT